MTGKLDPLIDETDRQILQILQDSFPMVQRPYKAVADQLNLTEEQVIERLKRLSQQGVTRKIGAVVDNSKTELNIATLVALKVPKDKVDAVADVINQYPTVSHNYERAHEYNVWFTLKAKSQPELAATLTEITQKIALNRSDVLNLPTKACFKINVRFNMI